MKIYRNMMGVNLNGPFAFMICYFEQKKYLLVCHFKG